MTNTTATKKKGRGRRVNGEGSIYQRPDGKWCGQLTFDGKRRSFYGKTAPEVKAKMDAAAHQHKTGTLPDTRNKGVTYGEYLPNWLETYKKPALKPSSYARYEFIINSYITPNIGGKRLVSLRSADLQQLINKLHKSTGKTKPGKPDGLCGSTLAFVHLVLRQSLEQAKKDKLIAVNPAADLVIPRHKPREMKPLYGDDATAFLNAIADDNQYALFATALFTGLRRGEIAGLKWPDVDLKAKTLTVRRSIVMINREPVLQEDVKSSKSARTVSLPAALVTILQKHKATQAAHRLKMGAAYTDAGFVFPKPDGSPLNPERIYNKLTRILKKHGFEHRRFHDLRHSFATMMIEAGTDIVTVSQMMGHADLKTTSRYTHVSQEMQQRAADKLDALIGQRI